MYETYSLNFSRVLVSLEVLNLTTEILLHFLRLPSKYEKIGVHRTIDINSTRN